VRLAALCDIHGNLPALEAVLAEVRTLGVDRLLVGGDVLPGPMPRETLALLRGLDIPCDFIRGNGDREVVTRRRGLESTGVPEAFRGMIQWVADQLDDEDEAWLASWPLTSTIHVPGLGDVFFCHATPRNDTDIFTRSTPEAGLLPLFESVPSTLVVCGHTHMQFDRTIGMRRVVNAGSVGMPFGAPGADWVLLGPDVELRQTSYDLAAAAARVRRTQYPQAEEFVARNILQPPSQAEMIASFAKFEVQPER
jgi:predicted phosphodiesterase